MNNNTIHQAIVEACQRGERAAQFDLYQLYSKAMYNICLRMMKNEMDAQDVLQNSFVDVFTKIDRFRQESTIGAWIKRIVINNCINQLKKRKLNLVVIDEKIQIADETITENENENWTVETIKKAVHQLADGYRVVFSLYAFEGYDHKEIAEILNISEATSKSQYSRAKAKIRTIVKTLEQQ